MELKTKKFKQLLHFLLFCLYAHLFIAKEQQEPYLPHCKTSTNAMVEIIYLIAEMIGKKPEKDIFGKAVFVGYLNV